MRNQFVKTMTALMKEDERLYLLLGDIGVYGFREVLKEYPLRAQNAGICEQSAISLASGLAMTGFIPVAHSIAPFLVERAYEQLKIDFGYQQLGGNFVSVGASYNYNKLGSTHHCPADISILSQIPNMQIVVPGTAKEFDILFRECYDNGKPTYFRLSEDINNESHNVKFGRVLSLGGTGSRFTILVVGPALEWVGKTGLLNDTKIKVLQCNTVVPLDLVTIGLNIPNDRLIVVEPYYTTIVSNIVNTFPTLKVIPIAPDKEFVPVGFNLEKFIIERLIWKIERLRW